MATSWRGKHVLLPLFLERISSHHKGTKPSPLSSMLIFIINPLSLPRPRLHTRARCYTIFVSGGLKVPCAPTFPTALCLIHHQNLEYHIIPYRLTETPVHHAANANRLQSAYGAHPYPRRVPQVCPFGNQTRRPRAPYHRPRRDQREPVLHLH